MVDQAEMVRVDAWAEWPWLRAGFSTRLGGISTVYGPGTQNLGWTLEDEAAKVAANRQRFVTAAARGAAMELVTVRQVHGDVVVPVEKGHGPLVTPEGKAVLAGDGLMTDLPGVLLGVQTADCVPVLVVDTRRRAVAAFHAGWRGTLAGIVEKGVGELRETYGSRAEDLVAAIGPGIGPCCFAVGDEVRDGFLEHYAYGAALFSLIDGQFYADLIEANFRQLLEAGVGERAISVVGECTACMRVAGGGRKYFSHRAEKGVTGRMLSVVGVVAGGGEAV